MEAALDTLNCSQDAHTLRPRIQSTAQIHCDRKCGRSDTAVIGITDDSVGVVPLRTPFSWWAGERDCGHRRERLIELATRLASSLGKEGTRR